MGGEARGMGYKGRRGGGGLFKDKNIFVDDKSIQLNIKFRDVRKVGLKI